MMDFSSGFSVNTSTKQKDTQVSHSQIQRRLWAPRCFFSTRLRVHKHLVLHEGTALHQSLAFWVQQFGHAKLLLRYVKGALEVVGRVGPLQTVKFHQIRPERGRQRERERQRERRQRDGERERGGETLSRWVLLCAFTFQSW